MATEKWRQEHINKMRSYRRKWYYAHKPQQLIKQDLRARENLKQLSAYKETLHCAHCGIDFVGRPEICDFHHINPSKKTGPVSWFKTYGWKQIMTEVAKCIPLCANCHRTETKRLGHWKSKRIP
jgi:5-methylcytosine-specific restriction endonuclease McrA